MEENNEQNFSRAASVSTKSNSNAFNFLVVHGVQGFNEKNWYGWYADILRSEGHNVVVPQFQTELPPEGIALLYPNRDVPEHLKSYKEQTYSNWLEIAMKAMKGWDPARTIIVGHSLGGAAALQFSAELAKMNGGTPCHAVIVASPVGGDIGLRECGPGLETFYKNINGGAIRKSTLEIVVIVSDNDIDVPPEQSKKLADLCCADKVRTVPGGFHLNAVSGFNRKNGFPLVLQLTREALKRPIGVKAEAEPIRNNKNSPRAEFHNAI